MPNPRSKSVVARPGNHGRHTQVAPPDLVQIPEARVALGLLDWKLTIPPQRAGAVTREALGARLTSSRARFASVSAPAGYGKTIAVSQWARRDDRAFGWVTLDQNDNDPTVLISYITAALESVGAPVTDAFESLTSPAVSLDHHVVPLLGRAMAAAPEPFVLVLEDVHLVTDGRCRELIADLGTHIPPGSTLAVVGRRSPPLPLARHRADGELIEIGRRDLEMDDAEVEDLVGHAGAGLSIGEVASLRDSTERWPVALYLAARSVQRAADGLGHLAVDENERVVTDYVAEELLAGLPEQEVWFLTHSAVLEWMSGPLCDAVLGTRGSSGLLAELARSNLLLVPLDEDRVWYRYHGLFRDVLLARLTRHDPNAIPDLHRRASAWYEGHAMVEPAVHHSQLALDDQRSARLVASAVMSAYFGGRVATVERWLNWFDQRGAVERFPTLAVQGAVISALRGRPADAERWATAASRGSHEGALSDGTPIRAWVDMMHATMCSDGPEQMLLDASRSLGSLPESSVWRSAVTVLIGVARFLTGDLAAADESLERGARLAADEGLTDTEIVALSHRSVIAHRRGDESRAAGYARLAHTLMRLQRLDGYATMGLTYAVAARSALREGDDGGARTLLAQGEERALPLLTFALPNSAVLSRLEFARVYLELREVEDAQRMLSQAQEVLERRPNLGTLGRESTELAAQLQAVREALLSGSRLTGAELRVLPFLPGHLSFRQIGVLLHLSQHTVKTQAISIYRKLGASSRREAVDRAAELHLFDQSDAP